MRRLCYLAVAILAIGIANGCGPSPEEQAQAHIKKTLEDPKKIMYMLNHANPAVRVVNVKRLGDMGESAVEAGAVEKLESLREEDPSKEVREAAEEALQKLQ